VSCQIVEVMSDTEAILKCDITTKTSTSGGTVAYKVYPYVNQAAMFSSVFDRLNDGGAVGIFPEGGSHDRTQLLPLKAGAAMMALGAMAKYENLQVRS
jgi:glycerol-3-phosphate O-acyltransferase/dihydroxyacetone phosphate acyltransferase